MDRKDEIIKLQMDVITQMTRNQLGHIYDDLWGAPAPTVKGDNAPKAGSESTPETPVIPDMPVMPNAPIMPDMPAEPVAGAEAEQQASAEAKAEEAAPESIDDLKKELNDYIGLNTIKQEVESLINLITVQNLRKKNDLPIEDISLHMVFSGNPGTGKTMIARLMARIYKTLGILSKGQLIEVDRGGLVAGFVGQTALKTSEVIQKALGGVLFIDEAYALTNRGANDFGQEAVDTLLKAMEDHRDDLIVIVAGYIELMEGFIHSNPGLESRFNRFLNFPDYSVQEMMDIFEMRCGKSGYELAEDAKGLLSSLLALYSLDVKGFGNARGVRNLFERAVSAQANRLAKLSDITREQLMLLTVDDIRVAGGGEDGSSKDEPQMQDMDAHSADEDSASKDEPQAPDMDVHSADEPQAPDMDVHSADEPQAPDMDAHSAE